jgi:hypothetical protein
MNPIKKLTYQHGRIEVLLLAVEKGFVAELRIEEVVCERAGPHATEEQATREWERLGRLAVRIVSGAVPYDIPRAGKFAPGTRVELCPSCDLWIRGARYGTVVSAESDQVVVRLDHPSVKGLVRFNPDDLRATEHGADYGGLS